MPSTLRWTFFASFRIVPFASVKSVQQSSDTMKLMNWIWRVKIPSVYEATRKSKVLQKLKEKIVDIVQACSSIESCTCC